MNKKGTTYKWGVKQAMWGADSPLALYFDNKADRDFYLKTHDYCNSTSRVKLSWLFDGLGGHYGIFVVRKGDLFFDEDTGEEINDGLWV